jgi:hypothetical protein
MATYKARVNTDINASPQAKAKVKELHGRRRVMLDDFTMGTTAGLIGDIINFGRLPRGAKILSVRAEVDVASFGAGVTFDLGHSAGLNSSTLEAADSNSIAAGLDGAVLAVTEYMATSDFIYKELADDIELTATVAGANFAVAPTAKLILLVEYSLD